MRESKAGPRASVVDAGQRTAFVAQKQVIGGRDSPVMTADRHLKRSGTSRTTSLAASVCVSLCDSPTAAHSRVIQGKEAVLVASSYLSLAPLWTLVPTIPGDS